MSINRQFSPDNFKETNTDILDTLGKESTAKTAIVLGSGWSSLTNRIKIHTEIPFNDIINFPQKVQKLAGHASTMIFGTLGAKEIIVLNGRYHYYEGYNGEEIAYPIRVLKDLGIENLILTNASGALRKRFHPGNLYPIENHISTMIANPLRGENYEEFGDRFVPQGNAYDKELLRTLLQTGEAHGKKLQTATYVAVEGPTFETTSDVDHLKNIAELVGMSTVPECIVANHAGMKVAGMSMVSNFAEGVTEKPISHAEVCKMVETNVPNYADIISDFIQKI